MCVCVCVCVVFWQRGRFCYRVQVGYFRMSILNPSSNPKSRSRAQLHIRKTHILTTCNTITCALSMQSTASASASGTEGSAPSLASASTRPRVAETRKRWRRRRRRRGRGSSGRPESESGSSSMAPRVACPQVPHSSVRETERQRGTRITLIRKTLALGSAEYLMSSLGLASA